MKQKRTSVHLSKASALAVLLAAICVVAASLDAVAAPKLIIAGDSSTSDHDEPSKDTTHTVDAGAEVWAKAFVEDVKKRNLDVATIFR